MIQAGLLPEAFPEFRLVVGLPVGVDPYDGVDDIIIRLRKRENEKMRKKD